MQLYNQNRIFESVNTLLIKKIIRPTSERISALLQYFIYFTADFYRQIIIETQNNLDIDTILT